MPTLRELSIEYATKQPKQVDQITEEAPILDIVNFEKASHAMWNVYEEVTDVTEPGFVEMNAPLPKVAVSTELRKLDLAIMGGEAEVPEDKAQLYGGAAKYFAKRMPVIHKKAGMATEKAILYNNMRQWALDKGNALSAGGSGYSIIACRFISGETCGLYSPEGFKNGAMLDVKPMSGGGLYKDANGVLVYGLRLKGFFGFQIANNKSVAVLANIDKNHVPTAAQIDDLLAMVHAGANTYLFMHPKTKNMLNKYKADQLWLQPGEKDVNRLFEAWNGVPIKTSWNFLDGLEAAVNLS